MKKPAIPEPKLAATQFMEDLRGNTEAKVNVITLVIWSGPVVCILTAWYLSVRSICAIHSGAKSCSREENRSCTNLHRGFTPF